MKTISILFAIILTLFIIFEIVVKTVPEMLLNLLAQHKRPMIELLMGLTIIFHFVE